MHQTVVARLMLICCLMLRWQPARSGPTRGIHCAIKGQEVVRGNRICFIFKWIFHSKGGCRRCEANARVNSALLAERHIIAAGTLHAEQFESAGWERALTADCSHRAPAARRRRRGRAACLLKKAKNLELIPTLKLRVGGHLAAPRERKRRDGGGGGGGGGAQGHRIQKTRTVCCEVKSAAAAAQQSAVVKGDPYLPFKI